MRSNREKEYSVEPRGNQLILYRREQPRPVGHGVADAMQQKEKKRAEAEHFAIDVPQQ